MTFHIVNFKKSPELTRRIASSWWIIASWCNLGVQQTSDKKLSLSSSKQNDKAIKKSHNNLWLCMIVYTFCSYLF